MTIFQHSSKKMIPILVLVELASAGIFGQSGQLERIVKQFDTYRTQSIQEKIFVHTDKSFYLAGETIWFKLYDVDGQFNKPLDLSKLAYVEIFSRELKPVLQAKIALSEGKGKGNFTIPSSVNSGIYVLRAYTNWMKNFPADFYFERLITIINPQKKPVWTTTTRASAFDIQFFPEGGNLVSGMQSKVAFRVVNRQGKGMDCKGVLVNDRYDTVARFQTLKFGLGQFLFTPVHGQEYTALTNLGGDSIIKQSLPVIYEKGYVMGLKEADKDQLLISVSTNVESASPFIYLFGHTRNIIRLSMAQPVNNGRASFLIDKKMLGEGVSHLTVFNGDLQPVCERLYFRRPAKTMEFEIKPAHFEYSRREKVSVALLAKDPSGLALQTDLSVSVFMTDSLQAAGLDDIQTYLWLNSDLKGIIESPEYYLKSKGYEADEAVENLILTHGWRRFRWENILQNNQAPFEFVPEYDGHIITGKITDKRSGQPAENIPAFLSFPGQSFKLNISTSDQNGQLHFDVKNLYGGGEMVVQTNTQKDSFLRIDISNPFDDKPPALPFPPIELSEKWSGLLNFRSMHTLAVNTFSKGSHQPLNLPEPEDSTAFYGNPDKKYFLDDYTRFVTMEEVMREYVTEVRLSKRREKFHFEVMNLPYRLFFTNDPLVLLDGVPVFDLNRIIEFDPLKIKKLEVISRKYFLDSVTNEGILSYSTYQGNLAGFQLDANALILEYPGIQAQTEFYTPVYESRAQSDSRLPDFRNVLYWCPNLVTDGQGKKTFSFYTSDLPGKYTIVVQGISAGGFSGSNTLDITVSK